MPEPTAHDTAMMAKVDSASAATNASAASPMGGTPGTQPAAQPTPAQRPEHVPEKFWDAATGQIKVEDLAKSYVELEKLRGTPAPEGTAKPAETPGQPDPAAAALAASKLDVGALSQEFATTGAISEASYKALETAGFGKEVVDGYIAGQVALAQARDAEGYAHAGGQEAFSAMTTWAATALPPADIEAFNAAVSGTPAQMKQAIVALKAQYEAAAGKEPVLTKGTSNAEQTGEQPFASRAEVTAAMRDPKYRADPAYRALVERRVGLMTNF